MSGPEGLYKELNRPFPQYNLADEIFKSNVFGNWPKDI
jgi:hypothetical protein